MDVEWTIENVFKLIDCYKRMPCLWDPSDENFKRSKQKVDAWVDLANVLGCHTIQVKKKINSLLTSFRRERRLEKRCKSIMGRNAIYKSKWFAFNRMKFLLDKFDQNEEEDNSNEQVFESEDDKSDNSDETEVENKNLSPTIIDPLNIKRKISPKKEIYKKIHFDPEVEEQVSYVEKQSVAVLVDKKDDCSVFGDHVACKLRTYSTRTKNIAEHHINNILFDADMGKYETEDY